MGLKYDIVSPFAGRIDRIRLRPGDQVEEGEVIFTLTGGDKSVDILSPVTGYAHSVDVEQGEMVIAGMILAVIQMAEDSL